MASNPASARKPAIEVMSTTTIRKTPEKTRTLAGGRRVSKRGVHSGQDLDTNVHKVSVTLINDERDHEAEGASESESRPEWQTTNESVRDAHRHALNQAPLERTRSYDERRLPQQFMARPSVGHASNLAVPGGFRRAHIDTDSGNAIGSTAPLVVDLETIGFNDHLVTEVVQTFNDGTQVTYNSRLYRRGVPADIRLPLKSTCEHEEVVLEQASRASFCYQLRYTKHGSKRKWIGVRWASVSYWVSINFMVGGALFTAGSVDWMVPNVSAGCTAMPCPVLPFTRLDIA